MKYLYLLLENQNLRNKNKKLEIRTKKLEFQKKKAINFIDELTSILLNIQELDHYEFEEIRRRQYRNLAINDLIKKATQIANELSDTTRNQCR